MGRSRLADFGACYLAVVGAFYVIAGAFGVYPNGQLIATVFWHILISPYPLITFGEASMNRYPPDLRFATISDLPGSEHATSSFCVLVIGIIATVAALAMFQRRRWPAWIWAGLLLISFALTCGYFLAHYAEPHFEIASSIRPSILEVTLIVAFLVSRTGISERTARNGDKAGKRKP